VLYHRYAESLFEECQLYVERADRYDPTQATPPLDQEAIKNRFVKQVLDLEGNMTNQYDQIVQAASTGALAPAKA